MGLQSYFTESNNIGFVLFLSLLFLPVIAIFLVLGIASIMQCKDYMHFSKEGIDFVLHPYSWFLEKRVSGFIRWDEIEEYQVTNNGSGRGCLWNCITLKLYNEDKPIRLRVYSLQNHGNEVPRYFRRFIPEKDYTHLSEINQEKAKRYSIWEFALLALFLGSFFLLFPFLDLFDKTFIVSWFWFPIMAGSMLLFVPLSRHFQIYKKISDGIFWSYVSAFSIGLILCYGVLKVNYVFADWESEPTIRSCEFIGVSPRYPRRGPKRIIGYSLKINTGKEVKNIDVSSPSQGQTETTIDFWVYKGALGLEVME